MTAYLRSPLTIVWLVLTLVTFATWFLSGRLGAGGVVAIALLKTYLVFWHFMEVRTAPAWLRWSCGGWLAFLGVMVLAIGRM